MAIFEIVPKPNKNEWGKSYDPIRSASGVCTRKPCLDKPKANRNMCEKHLNDAAKRSLRYYHKKRTENLIKS